MKLGAVSTRLAFLVSLNLTPGNHVWAQGGIPDPPNVNEVSPTVNTDVSSVITTGCGYDGWTGSVQRRVVDIEVPGAVSSHGLKYVRTYSSSTGRWTGSYSWFIHDRPWSGNASTPIGWKEQAKIVLFPDGRQTINRGSKERLFEINTTPPPGESENGEYDLYLEDGSRVHFTRISNRSGIPPETGYWTDWVTPKYVIDPHGNETTLEYKIYEPEGDPTIGKIRLEKVTDKASGRFLAFTYAAPDSPVLIRIDGSNGDWVTYTPAGGLPTRVDYSDGTSAVYTYNATSTTVNDEPGGGRTPYPVLDTARDTRAEGPMQSIGYQYVPEVPVGFRGRVQGEYHLGSNLQPDALVSRFKSNASGDDDTEAINDEFRGDGPTRQIKIQKTDDDNEDELPGVPLVWFKTDFNGVSESYEYDGNLFLRQVTDRRGNITTYVNEPVLGNPTTITYPGSAPTDPFPFLPAITNYTYVDPADSDGSDFPYFVYSLTDERGKITTYDRYPRVNPPMPAWKQRIFKITYPDIQPDGSNPTEEFRYNDFGQVILHKRKNGYYEHAVYDETNPDPTRRTELLQLSIPVQSATAPAETAPDVWTKFTYYTTGVWKNRVQTVTDSRSNRTIYEYDRHVVTGAPCPGRGLVTKISYPDDTHNGLYPTGTSQSFTYDIYGNKRSETSEAGETTSYDYDDYKRLISVTKPLP